MARTPLLKAILRAWRRVRGGEAPICRREFLRVAPAVSIALAGAPAPARVVIVGAGLAGLYAAWVLKKAGVRANLYEASSEAGGRVHSVTDQLAPGLTTELGGEFLDSAHTHMLGLARQFGLELIDLQAPGEEALVRDAFLFGGALRGEAEMLREFRAIQPALVRDAKLAATRAGLARLDRLSLSAYLDSIGARGWIRSLLEVGFVTEFGLDAGDQSALNMLSQLAPESIRDKLYLYGESDERFKIRGGNQQVTAALARAVWDQLHTGHEFVSLRSAGTGYLLRFERRAAPAVEVAADLVLLAVPFTILRRAELRVPLPPAKRRAIHELGYGTGAKLVFGLRERVWRTAGYSGNLYSDEPFQVAWDSSRLQAANHGTLTLLSAGRAGLAMREAPPAVLLERSWPSLERAWPMRDQWNRNVVLRHWPTYRWTLGTYSCYRPGQWTTIRGHEAHPVGGLFFAGEHTSASWQGFMEGAAASGRRSAEEMLRRMGMVPSK